MANHINELLGHWRETQDQQQWVLATIIKTEGSSYRKAGAMMMINDLGQYYGMLSGGCLESDIMQQARRCWEHGLSRVITYDMREEEDLAWQLGIGCGGMVQILLQPVSKENQYLQLETLYSRLSDNLSTGYLQDIRESIPQNQLISQAEAIEQLQTGLQGSLFSQIIRPAKCLAIFGGGVDARPVVAIARQLGWRIILCDPRSGYAREAYFEGVSVFCRQAFAELHQAQWLATVNAALVMSHNVGLDAEALQILQHSSVPYVGLLGPLHRTERVLAEAQLSLAELTFTLANPVGLRLGGELPESIALSMLAEVHAFLEHTNGQSISGVIAS